MLERVVQYLHTEGVSFRLSSHSALEPLPPLAQRLPAGGLMLETHLLRIGGQPAIACVARGAKLSLPRLSHELATDIIEASPADLPEPYRGAQGPIPPLGREIGALVVLDEAVSNASSVTFAAFSGTDLIDISFDEFARLERPRVVSFAGGGELPASSDPEKRSA